MWAQARTVRFLAMDVDGVLTDGRIVFDEQGHELKNFHVHDGQGIALAHRAGCISPGSVDASQRQCGDAPTSCRWRGCISGSPIRCKYCKHC